MENFYLKQRFSTRRWYLIMLFTVFVQFVFAQSAIVSTTTVPSGSSHRKPLGVYFGYERSQMIYAPAELNNGITNFLGAGSIITAVSFYFTVPSGLCANPTSNTCGTGTSCINTFPYNLYMNEVGSPTIAAPSTFAAALGSLVPLASGSFSCPTWQTGGVWITVLLSTPYFYAGSNLQVLVETNYAASGDNNGWFPDGSENAIYFDRHTTVGNTFQTWQADVNPPAGNGGVSANRPTAKFDYIPATPCSSTPTLTTVSTVASTCGGTPFVLTLTPQSSILFSGLTYQWQSSPTGIGFTNIIGANGPSYTATQSSITYYRCIVQCTACCAPINSSTVVVTMNPYMSCFCISQPSFSNDGDIGSIQFGTLPYTNQINTNGACLVPPANLNTGANGTYSIDSGGYPNGPPLYVYTQGQASVINLCQITSNTFQFTSFFNVFIDYNHDGSFDPVAERVFSGGPTSNSANPVIYSVTGSITIPFSSDTGYTRMRVSLIENGNANSSPCNVGSFGEVEDYNIYIIPGIQCSLNSLGVTAASLPTACSGQKFTLSITGAGPIVGSSQTWTWQDSSSLTGGVWINIPGATTTTFTTSQTVNTWYRCFQSCPNLPGGPVFSGTSAVLNVPMSPAALCVCTSNLHSISCTGNFINRVKFNISLDNVNIGTGCTNNSALAYNTYPATGIFTTTLSQDSTYTLQVTTGGGSQSISCWIDRNYNGTFESSEWTQVSNFSAAGTFSVNIYIPIDTDTSHKGLTIMRIRSRATTTAGGNSSTNACTQFLTGETEDYLITLKPYVPPPCIPAAVMVLTTTNSAPATFCVGNNASLGLSGLPVASDSLTYQWESASPCGGAYTNIPGATTKTLIVSPTVTTSYRCKVQCNRCCTPADIGAVYVSTVACITVSPNFWVGTTSDWSDPLNWCAKIVPRLTDDVLIKRTQPGVSSPYYCPVVGRSDTLRAKNIVIEATDTITVYNDTLNEYNQAAGVTINGKFIIRTSPGDKSTLTDIGTQTISASVISPFRDAGTRRNRLQIIYTQTDFADLPELQTGQDLVYYLVMPLFAGNTVPSTGLQNYTISYAWIPTTVSAFTTNDPIPIPAANVVYSIAELRLNKVSPYNLVPTTPNDTVMFGMKNFKWRTDSNLVLQFCWSNASAAPNAVIAHQVRTQPTSGNQKMAIDLSITSGGADGCDLLLSTPGVATNFGPFGYRPNIKFVFGRPFKRLGLNIGGDVVVSLGGALIASSANLTVADTCLNNGTINLDSTNLTVGNVLINNATGLLDMNYIFPGNTANQTNVLNVNGSAFTNTGTFRAGRSPITMSGVAGQFNNTGTFNGGSATFIINGPGSTFNNSGGVFNADSGLIRINTGTGTFANGATFNAGSGTVLTKGTSFNNNGTFNAGTGAVEFNDTLANSSIGGSSAISFYRLRVNKNCPNCASTRIVTLSNTNVTVTDSINLVNGILDLNANTLTFTNPAVLSIRGVSGYLAANDASFNSKLKWTIGSNTSLHTFPFYKLPASVAIDQNYVPFEFTNMAGAADNVGDVTASTYATAANNLPLPTGVYHIRNTIGSDDSPNMADRYWFIQRSTAPSVAGNSTVAFSIAAAGTTNERAPGFFNNGLGNTAATWNPLKMQPYYQWTNGAGGIRTTWWPTTLAPLISQTAAVTSGSNQTPLRIRVQVATFTWPSTYLGFPVASNTTINWALSNNVAVNNPLPISLIDFNAKLLGDEVNPYVKLYWSTASEENNDYFTVERTIDFNSIKEIGNLDGNNGNLVRHYSLNDTEPVNGKVNYYRLKQTDLNGNSALPLAERWVPVRVGLKQVFNINFIRVEDEMLKVIFDYDLDGPVDVTVTDMTGRVIFNQNAFAATSGLNILSVDPTVWSQGLYMITLHDKDRKVSHKMFH